MQIILIAAMNKNRVIGRNNSLPWKNSEDMKFFKETTSGHAVLMGRKTWESVGTLKNRFNLVVSTAIERQATDFTTICLGNDINVRKYNAYSDAVRSLDSLGFQNLFICGGAQIYETALIHHINGTIKLDKIVMTSMNSLESGDCFFPPILGSWKKTSEEVFYKDDHETHRRYEMVPF